MTATDLFNEIKPEWRDVPLLVKDKDEAVRIASINYVTSATGDRVIVIGGQTPKNSVAIANAESTK